MATAVDPDHVSDYILEADRELPKEEQTVWKIKNLSSREAIGATAGSTLETHRLAVLVALKGWENFLDKDGKVIIYPDDAPKAMKYMSLPQIVELGNHAMAECVMSEEERGKSTAG